VTTDDVAQRGDKVRVKVPQHKDVRGIVDDVAEGVLLVRLDTGGTFRVAPEGVTNYSAAARRAWQSMPMRAVGRPKSRGPRKKSVSLRIDADLWEMLGEAVGRGLIPSRERATNAWLREHVTDLLAEHTTATAVTTGDDSADG